jgi:hypothetical protein
LLVLTRLADGENAVQKAPNQGELVDCWLCQALLPLECAAIDAERRTARTASEQLDGLTAGHELVHPITWITAVIGDLPTRCIFAFDRS